MNFRMRQSCSLDAYDGFRMRIPCSITINKHPLGDAAQHSRAATLQASGVAAVSVGVDELADGILVVITSAIHLRQDISELSKNTRHH